MHTITCNIFETFYIVGDIEMELQILDIHGKQVKLGVKIDKSSYIANKKIKRKKTKTTPY